MSRLRELAENLKRYRCRCGRGGAMACEDDCPGDMTHDDVKELLGLLVTEVERLTKENRRMRDVLAGQGIIT